LRVSRIFARVQARSFARQQRRGIAGELDEFAIRLQRVPPRDLPFDKHLRVEPSEYFRKPRRAAQHRRFARAYHRARLLSGGDQLRRQIAGADILGQRRSDIAPYRIVERIGIGAHSANQKSGPGREAAAARGQRRKRYSLGTLPLGLPGFTAIEPIDCQASVDALVN